MKNNHLFLVLFAFALIGTSCEKNEVFAPTKYACDFNFSDSSVIHPSAAIYQEILDKHRKQSLVGAVLLVKDQDGLWIGSSGKADIASGVDMRPCNRFLIASITKVYTAAALFRYVDQGMIGLDDPVKDWVSSEISEKLANVDQSTIRHLLGHTSGIPDYYTMQYQLDIINSVHNGWRHEDIVEYAFGKNPTHAVGETYYYSNTNFLLLGLILEKVSGKSLEDVYRDEIFQPLNLTSAYFGKELPIPGDLVKGYADIYGNDQFVESEFLYKDELNTADGGIATNVYDLAIFMESLMNGDLISQTSLSEMTNWFDLPEDWSGGPLGHTQNGLGLEHFTTEYGSAVGHTGSIFGFNTIIQHFPQEDATYILLVNSASFNSEDVKISLYEECLNEMFQ